MKPVTSSITVVSVLCAIDVAGLAHLASTVFASLNLMLSFIRFVFLRSSAFDGVALRSITSLTLSSLCRGGVWDREGFVLDELQTLE